MMAMTASQSLGHDEVPSLQSGTSYDLAVIGNSTYSCIIDRTSRGLFEIKLENFESSVQFYDGCDSLILKTRLTSSEQILAYLLTLYSGEIVEVTDFCPRFESNGRSFKPSMLVRIVTPVQGVPQISVRCLASIHYNSQFPDIETGSNHIKFEGSDIKIRLQTNLSTSIIRNETTFALVEPQYFILSSDEPFNKSIEKVATEYLSKTKSYWFNYCRTINLPFSYQRQVMRCVMQLRLLAFDETGGIINSLTSSIPNQIEDAHISDMRYCWLKDSIFTVNALHKVQAIETLENYISFLINIARFSLKKEMPIETSYHLVINKSRTYEQETVCLAGYEGLHKINIGQPFFNFEMDSVNPIGSIILAINYMFYDIRLIKLSKQANLSFVQDVLVKLAERAYCIFKRPLKYHLSYLKMAQDNLNAYIEGLAQSSGPQKIDYLEKLNIEYYMNKVAEIKKLGINTHSLVLISTSFKSLSQLCSKIAKRSQSVMNFSYENHDEEKHDRYLMEQSQIWEIRSIEVKEFVNKYGWCKKNQTYTSFIQVKQIPGKEEEQDKLLMLIQKKSKLSSSINLKHLDMQLYSHIEQQPNANGGFDEEEEKLYHLPDTHLLLWHDLDFITPHDIKFKQSFTRLQDYMINNPNLRLCEYLWQFNETGFLPTYASKVISPLITYQSTVLNSSSHNMSYESNDYGGLHKTISTQGSESSLISIQLNAESKYLGNFPESQSLVHFIITAFKLSKQWENIL
ncbi:glucoamylase [Stylonychia lemnae]|uniref:Glucoamylase n=1 Tax=Stylonychia lemnae TaxID=5949 RepID=A0A077ZXH9_STYLE|nr:glucoamylase [Stylonychia lemnae]|eukprot:CDW74616.1 glucoamylase [Stylonychia lemnae]